MSPADQFVVAIDAGGTHTRVGCFALDGVLLGRADGAGGGPHHNHRAAEHVSATIIAALAAGGLEPGSAVALVAGIAGYELDRENTWSTSFFDGSVLDCPRQLVNDAVIAHRGALAGRPGIIVVAGTGSMIMAITESQETIESGRFQHYAGGARHLVHDVIQQILIGTASPADAPLVEAVLAWSEVDDLDRLRCALLRLKGQDHNEVKRRYGALAPTVTAAADRSPLADAAVRRLARKTAIGVRLLAPLIGTSPVPVALSGALATAPAFTDRFAAEVSTGPGAPDDRLSPARIAVVDPVLGPLGGAALLALESVGVTAGPAVLARLQLVDG